MAEANLTIADISVKLYQKILSKYQLTPTEVFKAYHFWLRFGARQLYSTPFPDTVLTCLHSQ